MPLELLRTTNGVLNRYWYERDGLGNVVALTDVNGNLVDQYAYDLWGTPTLVSESVPQQLRYAGYWYDTELGWYWLTTRAYDPALKRFLQPDPSQMDGLYSYVYVGDDPVDGSDPSGFASTYRGMLFDGGPDGGCIVCQPGATPSNPVGILANVSVPGVVVGVVGVAAVAATIAAAATIAEATALGGSFAVAADLTPAGAEAILAAAAGNGPALTQTPDQVKAAYMQELASSGKAAAAGDVNAIGHQQAALLASYLYSRDPNLVIQFQVRYGAYTYGSGPNAMTLRNGDDDVGTRRFIFESSASEDLSGKLAQIDKEGVNWNANRYTDRYGVVSQTRREVLLFAPNLNPQATQILADEGIGVVRTFEAAYEIATSNY
jgi:RHS repeat-associated protein